MPFFRIAAHKGGAPVAIMPAGDAQSITTGAIRAGVVDVDPESHEISSDCCVMFPSLLSMLDAVSMAVEASPSRLAAVHVTHMAGRITVYVSVRASAGDSPLDLVDALEMDYVGSVPIGEGSELIRFVRRVSDIESIALTVVVPVIVKLPQRLHEIWNQTFANVDAPMTALKRFMTAGIRLA